MKTGLVCTFGHATSFSEKIRALQQMPDGAFKERHLMRLFLKAEHAAEFWEIYWTTADPELQDDSLVAILRYPNSPEDTAAAIELASESVRRFVDIHTELRTASRLLSRDITNRERLIIARTTHDSKIREYALESLLMHEPQGSELLEIIQNRNFDLKIRRAAETLLASVELCP
jgi:hypothetical protein